MDTRPLDLGLVGALGLKGLVIHNFKYTYGVTPGLGL